MSRAGSLLFAVVALAACGVELADVAGRACDEQHPCRAPRGCVDGLCVDGVDPGDGGAGGGGGGVGVGGGTGGGIGGGAGGGTGGGAGGGGGSGAAPLWRQSLHGFTGQSVLSGCMLEVDKLRGNRVVSTVANANDTSDRSTANHFDGGRLPMTGNGRLRGRFQLPAALKLTNTSPFVWLAAGTRPVVSFAFNSSGQLVTTSASGMVGPLALTNTVTFTGGFQPNVDYLLEVAWQRHTYRSISINGNQVVLISNLGDAGAVLETPDQLRLGVYRYDGTADAGWSIALFDWQLTDNPSVVLSD